MDPSFFYCLYYSTKTVFLQDLRKGKIGCKINLQKINPIIRKGNFMANPMFEMMLVEQERQELQCIITCNNKSENFGVVLTEEEARELMVCKNDILKSEKRVEFGDSILPKLIEAFCDSQYIDQGSYSKTLMDLLEMFYIFKNESMDELTDDELIAYMKEQFEGVCFGSLEYLADTCLERYTRAIRAGYKGYEESGGLGEYEKFSEEARWDRKLFLESLWDLLS